MIFKQTNHHFFENMRNHSTVIPLTLHQIFFFHRLLNQKASSPELMLSDNCSLAIQRNHQIVLCLLYWNES